MIKSRALFTTAPEIEMAEVLTYVEFTVLDFNCRYCFEIDELPVRIWSPTESCPAIVAAEAFEVPLNLIVAVFEPTLKSTAVFTVELESAIFEENPSKASHTETLKSLPNLPGYFAT